MKKLLSVAGAALLTALAAVFALGQPAQAATGFSVSNGRLYDANGVEFVMRGVNHAHTWYPQQTSSFANIKALGANTVRVVLSSGDRWTKNSAADVANVISLCKSNRMICVLEVHDTTGYGEDGAATTLAKATDYWLSIADVLKGQERYVIVNIGNEPFGNQGYSAWTTDTSNAIKRLRAAGLTHTIMVDAPNWGQDWSFTMRDNAGTVFAADPQRNTVFSIHMYGVFDTAAEISDYLGRFRTAGLPIVVGEFGFNHSDGNPDEDAIMAYAQANGIGYLGWSWSGNGGGVEYLDMTTSFNPAQLTSWGQRIFNGANGIAATSREASVYASTTPTASPTVSPTASPTTSPTVSPTPPTTPPPSGGCTATYTVANSWQGGFQGEVKVTAGAAAITGWTVRWTYANGQSVTQAWNASVSNSGSAYTARNVDYNGRLGAGASTTFGFIGSWQGTNSTPAVTCTSA
ncbi:mannan endo-1,4-beta-mannosidase [Micromonospora sp. HB375]|uniref:cellulase family glycosylhydrolase n=1 Tax=unclassified Micromonospora TaxID=2617518 RepID=UPI001AE2C3E4|nr:MULTISPECIES: cellulase family glycosylhydrolase [unclassified Micromonospora]MBP1781776.1 mannan endo-1,4-beta-mannosidase [Micromonospora sp. HB375]MDH6466550.1 mannan endo-1,4-beta-mannosidase [Micromonospora sp. H404/HB375]